MAYGPRIPAEGLNPLFGGSAFRTVDDRLRCPAWVLIPFLAGLLFGPRGCLPWRSRWVLIPFLAGLLFGQPRKEARHGIPVLIPFLAGLLFGP